MVADSVDFHLWLTAGECLAEQLFFLPNKLPESWRTKEKLHIINVILYGYLVASRQFRDHPRGLSTRWFPA